MLFLCRTVTCLAWPRLEKENKKPRKFSIFVSFKQVEIRVRTFPNVLTLQRLYRTCSFSDPYCQNYLKCPFVIQKSLCNFVQFVKYVTAIRIEKTEYTGILSESVQSPVLKTFFEIPVPRWRVPSPFPPLFNPVRRRRRRVSPFSLSSLLRGRGSPAQKDRKAKEEHRQSIALRVQCLCSPLLAASTSSADSRSCCLPPPPFARAPRAGERSLGKSCCSSKEKKREKGKKRTKRRPNGQGKVIFRTTSAYTALISTKQEDQEVARRIPQPGERHRNRLPSGFNRPGSSQRRGDVKSGPTPRPRQPGESGPVGGTRRATTGFSLRRAGRLTPGE